VTARSEPLTPASSSSLRPNSHSRSERRLRYARIAGCTGSPDSTSRTTPRSARRQIVRAMSKAAAAVCSPEIDQSETMPSSASRRCTSAVRRSTISSAIGTCGFGLCGGVAIADPTLNSSRCTECVNALISALSQIDRAKPSVEISSSTLP
jgi:hypothetical protein